MNVITKKNFAPVPHKNSIDESRQVRGLIKVILRGLFLVHKPHARQHYHYTNVTPTHQRNKLKMNIAKFTPLIYQGITL